MKIHTLPLVALLACSSDPQQPSMDAGARDGCAACEDAASTAADGCVTIAAYPDADGDGFGDSQAAPAMVCADQLDSGGFVANNTDCADHDSRAHPGQENFYGNAPIQGPQTDAPDLDAGENRYDFNCDGRIELQYVKFTPCAAAHTPDPGWESGETIPDCGHEARLNVAQCEHQPTPQGCR